MDEALWIGVPNCVLFAVVLIIGQSEVLPLLEATVARR